MGRIFTVRLVRPVFETLVIEVEAWGRKSARQKALDRTDKLPASDWAAVTFDDREYRPHVASIIDNQEVHETAPAPHEQFREHRMVDQMPRNIRYMILAADLKNREGHWLPQPWFDNAEPLTQADLCSGWIEPFSFIIENDGLGEDQVQSPSGCQTNVIDFPVDCINEEVGQLTV